MRLRNLIKILVISYGLISLFYKAIHNGADDAHAFSFYFFDFFPKIFLI